MRTNEIELYIKRQYICIIVKACPHQAKANAKAKIVFDVCRLFFDLFRVFFDLFRFRFRSVWTGLKPGLMWAKSYLFNICVQCSQYLQNVYFGLKLNTALYSKINNWSFYTEIILHLSSTIKTAVLVNYSPDRVNISYSCFMTNL